jgi:predicted RecA/RadA family phage recombinase
MKNYIQPGQILSLTAPAGGVSSDDGVQLGQIFGVAVKDAAAGEPMELAVEGVFELPCKTTDDVSVGDLLYWDDSESELTTTATANLLVGAAVDASGTSDSDVKVVLSVGPRANESE